MRDDRERGAAAVEFAILLPVLLLLLLGIMELGRAYNVQMTLTNSAREGVRVMALADDQSQAKAAASNAAKILAPTSSNSTITFSTSPTSSPATCAHVPGGGHKQVTLTFSYQLSTLTGIAGPFTLTGKGTMLCGG
ncbi:TadE/TadG family type IV pilus assembly protein [Arthrobacter sp. D2-10]